MKVSESNTNWGAYSKEQKLSFPCDRFILCYDAGVYYSGISTSAPPKVIFQRLCQLRPDLHSYDWIDNFGTKTPETLTPGMDDLLVGQQVMKSFKLVDPEQDRHIITVLARKATTSKLESRMGYNILSRLFGYRAISYHSSKDRNYLPTSCKATRAISSVIICCPMRIFLPRGDNDDETTALKFKKLSEREKIG